MGYSAFQVVTNFTFYANLYALLYLCHTFYPSIS